MIQVSDTAAKKILALRSEESRDEHEFLRIRVKKGGCSGFSYKLDFDSQLSENDKEYEINGIKVTIDKESLLYLIGMVLDYEGGLNGQGFVFSNPNATKTCGCGSSFAV